MSVIIIGSLLFGGMFYLSEFSPVLQDSNSNFDNQRFILRNFDKTRPMANFLHGLGDVWGIPMWAFYVNRGQGESSLLFRSFFFRMSNDQLNSFRHHFFWKTEQRFSCGKIRDGKLLFVLL
jgi:hypothetical protein